MRRKVFLRELIRRLARDFFFFNCRDDMELDALASVTVEE